MYDSSSISSIITFLFVLFFSVSFHETMHALVAYKLGDDLAHSRGRISLNPLRHIDPYFTIGLPLAMLLLGLPPILAAKPVPINPNRVSGSEFGLAAVGLAGPLSNLLLAGLASFVAKSSFVSGSTHDVVLLFIQLNVGLFVFNMLPIPPLDGSRALYAVAPQPVKDFMERMESMGLGISLMIIFVFIPFLEPLLRSAREGVLTFLLGAGRW